MDGLEKWRCDAWSVADAEAKGRGQRVRREMRRDGYAGNGAWVSTDLRECEAEALKAPLL